MCTTWSAAVEWGMIARRHDDSLYSDSFCDSCRSHTTQFHQKPGIFVNERSKEQSSRHPAGHEMPDLFANSYKCGETSLLHAIKTRLFT